MRIMKMAARFYAGYKMKAISLFIFITICMTVIMGAVDLLYNSFEIWFGENATYLLPRFFVCPMKDFDIFKSNYQISNIAIEKEKREALFERLGKDFRLYDVAYFFCSMNSKRIESKRLGAFVIGLNFDELDSVYPFFEGEIPPEKVQEYQEKPLVFVDSEFATRAGIIRGEEFVLLTNDYFKDYNGIRVKVERIVKTPLAGDDSNDVPAVYIDLRHLRKLFAIPAEKDFPLMLRPKKPAPVFSLANLRMMRSIEAAAKPLGLSSYSVANVSGNISSIFEMYQAIFLLLMGILVALMIASISSSLFINFQNRKADFGVMKAFGCTDSKFFGLIVAENALGLAGPIVLAVLGNFALGAATGTFEVMNVFKVTFAPTPLGAEVVLALSAFICLSSSIQPFRYLQRIDPVAIMREE